MFDSLMESEDLHPSRKLIYLEKYLSNEALKDYTHLIQLTPMTKHVAYLMMSNSVIHMMSLMHTKSNWRPGPRLELTITRV